MDLTDLNVAGRDYPRPSTAHYSVTGSPGGQCASLALRVGVSIDLDALTADLRRLWLARSDSNRRQSKVEFSVVEPCAGTRAERERDAMRLLELESAAHRGGGLAMSLRATLVTLDPDDHLLLVAAPASTSTSSLHALVDELAALHPLCRA